MHRPISRHGSTVMAGFTISVSTLSATASSNTSEIGARSRINPSTTSSRRAGAGSQDDASKATIQNSATRASADASRKLSDVASFNNIASNATDKIGDQVTQIKSLVARLDNANAEEKDEIEAEIDSRLSEISRIESETRETLGADTIQVTTTFNSGDAELEQSSTVATSSPQLSLEELGLASFSGETAAADTDSALETLDRAAATVAKESSRLTSVDTGLRAIAANRAEAANATDAGNAQLSEADATSLAQNVAAKIAASGDAIGNKIEVERVKSLLIEDTLEESRLREDSQTDAASTREAES